MNLNMARGFIGSRINTLNAPIQQIKAAGQNLRGQTTQGLPDPVTDVTVSVTKVDATTRTLRVSFKHNPNDKYFTDADLYLQLHGNNNATLIAMGTSPIIVNVQRSDGPAIVTVVSSGNWGVTPLADSPGIAVSLA